MRAARPVVCRDPAPHGRAGGRRRLSSRGLVMSAEVPAPRRAMLLAAGFGRRMRPLTATAPKPLLEVHGKALIDHALDRLAEAGVETAVVNVHHLADQVESHVRGRRTPRIVVSDERDRLL